MGPMTEKVPENKWKGAAFPTCVAFVTTRRVGQREQLVANFSCGTPQVHTTTASGARPTALSCLDDLCAKVADHVCHKTKGASPDQFASAATGGEGPGAAVKKHKGDMVFSLRKSNTAYKREAEKIEWREAAQFEITCTDDWQSTAAGRMGKSSALSSVRRALAAACSSNPVAEWGQLDRAQQRSFLGHRAQYRTAQRRPKGRRQRRQRGQR